MPFQWVTQLPELTIELEYQSDFLFVYFNNNNNKSVVQG